MTYIPQGYENTTDLLSFYVVDSEGMLVDAYAIEYRIFDESGVQHTPQNKWNDAKNGKFQTGCYRAMQDCSCDDEGWTPPSDAGVGTWRIEWRWQINSGDAWKKWRMYFDVVESFNGTSGFRGIPYRSLVTPASIRGLGLDAVEFPDATLESLMIEAQAVLEDSCRQMFRPFFQTVRIQGNDANRLFLYQPIIGIDEVVPNRSDMPVDPQVLAINFERVDGAIPFRPNKDARRNPYVSYRGRNSVYTPTWPSSTGVFPVGRLNNSISGVFGFLEADGTVPILLQKAARILVYRTAIVWQAGPINSPAGPMTSKTVDRHSVSYANTGGSENAYTSSLLKSKDVQEIVQRYKNPVSLGSPDPAFAVSNMRLVQ
jgi:hypothetical protein